MKRPQINFISRVVARLFGWMVFAYASTRTLDSDNQVSTRPKILTTLDSLREGDKAKLAKDLAKFRKRRRYIQNSNENTAVGGQGGSGGSAASASSASASSASFSVSIADCRPCGPCA